MRISVSKVIRLQISREIDKMADKVEEEMEVDLDPSEGPIKSTDGEEKKQTKVASSKTGYEMPW